VRLDITQLTALSHWQPVGWDWTERVDNFAIGCIIAEMVLSNPPLPTADHWSVDDSLYAMENVIGPFPDPIRNRINIARPDTLLLDDEEYEVGPDSLKACTHP
jgi:hypothetical protein